MKKALRETQTLRADCSKVRTPPVRPPARCHKPADRTGPYAEGYVLYVCIKFEADRSFRSKVIRGPEISTLGHVTQATPILASFCFLYAGGVRRPSLYQI